MNKIMEREYDYIRGNTAVNPNRKYKEFDEEQRKKNLEKAERERKRKLIALRDKKTKNIIHIALVVCALGVVTIMREGRVYKVQQQLTEIKYEVKNLESSSEALRVDLLKFSSLDNIKVKAQSIGMINPNKSQSIIVDMSKNYFPELTKDTTNKKEKENLFSMLTDALGN